MQFEWDVEKERANRDKHEISFEDVTELFTSGVDYLEIYDHEHGDDENRFIAIGPVRSGVVLVVYTERGDDSIRLISARRATKQEERRFRQRIEANDE